MRIALPNEVDELTCSDCGADAVVNNSHTADVNAHDGKATVWLLCGADCGWLGGLRSWVVTRAEYEALYGHVPHHLLLPGDERLLPPAPDARALPPGPWGYQHVPPSPIPDEAWERPCPNQVGPRGRTCGAILIPNPTGVFFHDEFTSTTTIGFRCDVCQRPVLEHLSWPLTPEQHGDVFGRAVGEYRPEFDPEDPDDFEAEYSLWRTADRWGLTHFRSLDDLAATEDVDLLSTGQGEFTVKHWPTGAVWDLPDFIAQHEQIVTAAYTSDDGHGDSYDSYDHDGDGWLDEDE
jgi:hypothetical protein